MGIVLSTNTSGITNLNLFGAYKIGDDQIQTLAGLFANINLDGGPFVTGFFGETNIVGHGISLSYSGIEDLGDNLQVGLRFRLFEDEYKKIDFNLLHNSTTTFEDVKFSRYGCNFCWSFREGCLISIGATQSPSLNSTTMDCILKANLWKSENENFSVDVTTNASFYVHGPFAGRHNYLASLTASYNLFSNKSKSLDHKPPEVETYSITN